MRKEERGCLENIVCTNLWQNNNIRGKTQTHAVNYSRKKYPKKDIKIQNKDYYGKWGQETIRHTSVLSIMLVNVIQ
jgi:hypothetical protein